jgi:hypothetical protein
MPELDQLMRELEAEHAAFEAHMLNDFGCLPTRDGGGYVNVAVQLQWITWQAARAHGVEGKTNG